jgi:hypothetical protein
MLKEGGPVYIQKIQILGVNLVERKGKRVEHLLKTLGLVLK